MRIYEFSQQKNIPSKDLIKQLQQHGFDVKNHMAVLSDKALSFLEKTFKSSSVQKSVSENQAVTHSEKTNDSFEKINESAKKVKEVSKIEESLTKTAPSTPALVIHDMAVNALAEEIKKSPTDVIVTLLKWGILVTKNQILSEDIVKRIADHYNIPTTKTSLAVKEAPSKELKTAKKTGLLKQRLPIVVVVGHVDHGKTTLLDYIRKTRVAFKEKGGITQHLGAYEAVTPHGNIVFLDTPGHEAFIKIRQRGIKVADLVILVVAADDGVMPQTVEAIKYAQSMHVPIIVAINKIDKVDVARLEVIKRQLNQHGITVEEWGGDVVSVPISAKNGTGIDQLLEMIILQSEMMELRAEINVPAHGYILESSMEKGRGSVATVICLGGILHTGDYFICGKTSGRVSSLTDSSGKQVKEVGASVPVRVAGFDDSPGAGDFFEVIPKEDYLKLKISKKDGGSLVGKRLMQEQGINLVVKADNYSSLEAVTGGIDKLSKNLKKGFNIIRQEVGDVSEGDIEFSSSTGSRIVCFNVKAETNANTLAERRKVTVEHYGIIYKLLEALEALAEKNKEIELVHTKIGEATVIRVFDIKKIGVVAGAVIRDGRFTRDGSVVIWRGRSKIGEGKISSLQRDKKSVKEVHTGFECAFMVTGFSDWMIDDRVECFVDMPKK